VVWRFPVVLPTDIQVWQAKEWPKDRLQRGGGRQVSMCITFTARHAQKQAQSENIVSFFVVPESVARGSFQRTQHT